MKPIPEDDDFAGPAAAPATTTAATRSAAPADVEQDLALAVRLQQEEMERAAARQHRWGARSPQQAAARQPRVIQNPVYNTHRGSPPHR